jgi:hypothetical protein
MIPRYQRILFWSLALCSLVMALVLARGCQQANARLSAMHDESPIAAPVDTPQEPVTIALANDNDDSVALQQVFIALPQDPALRARALLERLLADYAKPDSLHPLPTGAAIADVFFVELPESPTASVGQASLPGVQVAVVNLRGTFADQHPSGIEAEGLTLRSIVGTLHANFPQIDQVRFLVDGQPRETLAGHAVLNRPYPSLDTVDHPLHVLAPNGTRE